MVHVGLDVQIPTSIIDYSILLWLFQVPKDFPHYVFSLTGRLHQLMCVYTMGIRFTFCSVEMFSLTMSCGFENHTCNSYLPPSQSFMTWKWLSTVWWAQNGCTTLLHLCPNGLSDLLFHGQIKPWGGRTNQASEVDRIILNRHYSRTWKNCARCFDFQGLQHKLSFGPQQCWAGASIFYTLQQYSNLTW